MSNFRSIVKVIVFAWGSGSPFMQIIFGKQNMQINFQTMRLIHSSLPAKMESKCIRRIIKMNGETI